MLTSVSDLGALVVSYERPEQPLDLVTEACNNIGLALGKDIHLAINCAAHELVDYVCKTILICAYSVLFSFTFEIGRAHV